MPLTINFLSSLSFVEGVEGLLRAEITGLKACPDMARCVEHKEESEIGEGLLKLGRSLGTLVTLIGEGTHRAPYWRHSAESMK